MKKFIALMMVFAMSLSLFAGCAKEEAPATTAAPATEATTAAKEEATTAATEAPTVSGDIASIVNFDGAAFLWHMGVLHGPVQGLVK